MATRKVSGAAFGFAVIIVNVALVAVVVISTSEPGWSGLFGDDSDAAPTASPTSTLAPTATPPQATDPAPTTGPNVTVSPGPPATSEPEPEITLEQRFADGDDLTVVVLGDQTGADPADWVLAWARQLTGVREVEVHTTSPGDPTSYGAAEVLGDGDSRITIYNASHPGNTPAYTADRLGALLPDQPDVVLLNFGRSNGPDDIGEQLDVLWADLQLDRGLDTRLVIQPARQDGQPTLDGLTREWADDVGAERLDVAAVFADEGIVEGTVSNRDPLSVNFFGADRWAQIVQGELFGAEAVLPAAGGGQAALMVAPPPANQTPAPTVPPAPPVEPPPPADPPEPTEPSEPTDPPEPTEPVEPPDPVDPDPTDPEGPRPIDPTEAPPAP